MPHRPVLPQGDKPRQAQPGLPQRLVLGTKHQSRHPLSLRQNLEDSLLLTSDTSRSLIRNMTLTQADFDVIEKMMDEKFEEQLRNIPSKDEFFTKMDEVVGGT